MLGRVLAHVVCRSVLLIRICPEHGMDAGYTLRVCPRSGLTVDGSKRDRLPWARDLAVSLSSISHMFADAEVVRSTLIVLGRSGIRYKDINGVAD